MTTRLRLAGLAILVVAAVPVGVALAAPLPPKGNPFYKPPASLKSYKPGAIIRSRRVDVTLPGGVPVSSLGATSYQLLYRTTNATGRAVANVTTVIVPGGSRPAGGRELVSLQDAEDSLTSNCAPSYQLQVGEKDNENLELEFGAAAPSQISAGRVLVIPDPEGERSEWLVRLVTARAVLDSIRAAERFAPAQLDGTRTPAALIGYSGGALETMAADELQRSYAPKLNVVGAAAGGTPVDNRQSFNYLETNASGVVMGAMLGLQRAYPRLRWSRLLNRYGRQVAATVSDGPGCATPAVSEYEHVGNWTTTKNPLGVRRIARAIAANALGHTAPKAPTFLYISEHDELISLGDEDKLAARYCADGAKLDYYRDPTDYPGGDDHVEAALAGFIPRALGYLSDRFAGQAAPDTCPARRVRSSSPSR